jgi:hypothetical protein
LPELPVGEVGGVSARFDGDVLAEKEPAAVRQGQA